MALMACAVLWVLQRGNKSSSGAQWGHEQGGFVSFTAPCTTEEGSVQGTLVQSRTENNRLDQENGLFYEQK